MKEFKDVLFYDNPEEKIFCYRSGLTVYEEKFEKGMLTAEGRNCAGFMLNVQDDLPSRFGRNRFSEPQSFDLSANGVSLNGTWKFIDFSKQDVTLENDTKVLNAKIVLESNVLPVRVTVETNLDGTQVIQRYYTVENFGDFDLALSDITVAGGGIEILQNWDKYENIPDYNNIYELGYPEECRWGHEGLFRWHKLNREGTFIPGRYLCDRHRHPMFILRNLFTGAVFSCQLAFSGGYRFDFYLDVGEHDAFLSFKANLDSANPFIVLQSGESYTVPAIHMEYLNGDVDDTVNEMHNHFRKSVFTHPLPNGLYGVVSGGMGPERTMDIKALKHGVDTFAEMGAQTMIIDAGWYCKPGEEIREWHHYISDWEPNKDKHPNGLQEIADYIHEKGLLFGLWLDLESAGVKSKLYHEHPDWMLIDKYGNRTTILDMTNPVVANWAKNELARVIETYGVQLFRLDNNVSFRDFYMVESRNRQSVYARYYKYVYEMYESLRKRFPDVLFENCAGGGGRTDIGLVKSFNHTWVSDWQKMPRGVAITNGMTMCLPPEYVDRLFAGMDSHIQGSLPMMLRHTLFGKPTVNVINAIGTKYNTQQLDFVKHTLKLYKDFVHPFANTCLTYHHTPEIYGEETTGDCVIERADAQKERSMIGVFRLAGKPKDKHITVYPKGISAEGEYEVYYDNSRATDKRTGFQLINNGIRVLLENALTSELILIKKI